MVWIDEGSTPYAHGCDDDVVGAGDNQDQVRQRSSVFKLFDLPEGQGEGPVPVPAKPVLRAAQPLPGSRTSPVEGAGEEGAEEEEEDKPEGGEDTGSCNAGVSKGSMRVRDVHAYVHTRISPETPCTGINHAPAHTPHQTRRRRPS